AAKRRLISAIVGVMMDKAQGLAKRIWNDGPTLVGFRPLLGIYVTLEVCESEPTTRCFVAGGIVECAVYRFASVASVVRGYPPVARR
ncbi:hypothetical protein HAX54_043311, partial [Datura stramonium]|nr:hypothetical protein [Datura stramonium]